LQAQGKNKCSAIILFSDGGFQGGLTNTRFLTVDEIIQYAIQNGISIYTVGYDLLGSDKAVMTKIALMTGGQYYSTNSGDDLSQLYTAIRQAAKDTCKIAPYYDCTVSYTAGCPDGRLRTVQLTVNNICGISATTTLQYTAPLDKSKFTKINVHIGDAIANANDTVLIPIILDTPINGMFSSGSFVIRYDESKAQLIGISTQGELLQNAPITVQDLGNGALITLLQNTSSTARVFCCISNSRRAIRSRLKKSLLS